MYWSTLIIKPIMTLKSKERKCFQGQWNQIMCFSGNMKPDIDKNHVARIAPNLVKAECRLEGQCENWKRLYHLGRLFLHWPLTEMISKDPKKGHWCMMQTWGRERHLCRRVKKHCLNTSLLSQLWNKSLLLSWGMQ